jgi:hypothetical protein
VDLIDRLISRYGDVFRWPIHIDYTHYNLSDWQVEMRPMWIKAILTDIPIKPPPPAPTLANQGAEALNPPLLLPRIRPRVRIVPQLLRRPKPEFGRNDNLLLEVGLRPAQAYQKVLIPAHIGVDTHNT